MCPIYTYCTPRIHYSHSQQGHIYTHTYRTHIYTVSRDTYIHIHTGHIYTQLVGTHIYTYIQDTYIHSQQGHIYTHTYSHVFLCHFHFFCKATSQFFVLQFVLIFFLKKTCDAAKGCVAEGVGRETEEGRKDKLPRHWEHDEKRQECPLVGPQEQQPVYLRHEHTSAYVSIRQHRKARQECPLVGPQEQQSVHLRHEHTSAYVSIRQHTSAYVSIRQHMSAFVSIRQKSSAYVSIREHTCTCDMSVTTTKASNGRLSTYLFLF